MDFWSVFIVGCIAGAIYYVFGPKKKAEVSPDIAHPRFTPVLRRDPDVAFRLARQRRRRLSGGFYPVGYAGPYLPGEDLIDDFIWMAELAILSDLERGELGEYGDSYYQDEIDEQGYPDEGDMQVEDPRESDEFVTEPYPVSNIEMPETVDPLPEEVVEEAPEAEEFVALDPEPEPAPAPEPEPEPEPERDTGGWGGSDDLSDSFGSDDSFSGGSDSDD